MTLLRAKPSFAMLVIMGWVSFNTSTKSLYANSAKSSSLTNKSRFPVSHRGATPGTSLEWWYLTGPLWQGNHCDPKTGLMSGPPINKLNSVVTPAWGTQLTFFYSGQGDQQGLLFHGGVSQPSSKLHEFSSLGEPWAKDKLSGLLGEVSSENLDIKLGPQLLALTSESKTNQEQSWWYQLTTKRYELRLNVKVDTTKIWKHGDDGFVQKTPDSANWYITYPFLPVRGVIIHKESGKFESVCGSLWFDHEIGVQAVDNLDWSWFSVRFANGKAYMFYAITPSVETSDRAPTTAKKKKKFNEKTVGESFAVTSTKVLPLTNIKIKPSKTACLKSGACYPQHFDIQFEENGKSKSLKVKSLFAEQEVRDQAVRSYWEGLADVTDENGDKGLAFVELTRSLSK